MVYSVGGAVKQFFDISAIILDPLVRTNSLYAKSSVVYSFSPHTPYGRVRLAREYPRFRRFRRFALLRASQRKENGLFCSLRVNKLVNSLVVFTFVTNFNLLL